jgi:O-succinylbenzoic acid--CoA ligase
MTTADGPAWLGAEPLGQRAGVTPERTALVDATGDDPGEDAWSFGELDGAVAAVAGRLRARRPADPPSRRIGVAVSPRVPFVVTLYAALRLGWTVAPLDPGMTPGELAERVSRIDPALLVCERGSERPCLATDRPVVSVDEPRDAAVSSLWVGVDDGDRRSDAGPPEAVSARSRDALVLFTSGTTSRPKAVRLTLPNLYASAVGSAFRLGVTPSDRWLGCLPVHHMGGLAPVFRSVWYGTTLVLGGSFEAGRTRDLLGRRGITGVSLVPTQLTRLLDEGWSPPATLRTVLLGGAPTEESLLARALDAGVPVCPTYGLTETASQVATARPTEVRDHPDSVGRPLPWTDVTIVADGDPVEPGERGEVAVDGPTVTPGYLDGATTEAAFGEYGLHTGDLGIRDADGRLRILGRIDDVVNTGGELVAPAEVCSVLESHPDVAAAAVVGVDDPEWGERVAALVVPADGDAVDGDRLRGHCRRELSEYKLPKTVVTAGQLPRTESGTVDRRAVATEIVRQQDEAD